MICWYKIYNVRNSLADIGSMSKWYNVYHFEALNKYRNIITFLAFGLKQQCPNDPHGRAKMTKG